MTILRAKGGINNILFVISPAAGVTFLGARKVTKRNISRMTRPAGSLRYSKIAGRLKRRPAALA